MIARGKPRSAYAAFAVATALALVAADARAQGTGATGQGSAPAQGVRREPVGNGAMGDVARSRMQKGDCAGALDAFDAALRTSNELALRRDRGICHETLGQPYPAIDDYRAYLTGTPDAPDAQAIRRRLRRLEDQTSGRAPTSTLDDDTDVPPVVAGSASATVSAGGAHGSLSSRAAEDLGTEQDVRSSLRESKGFGAGPFVAGHKWFLKGTSFGDRATWAECVGVQLRYSTGASGAWVAELGYEHFNSTDVDGGVVSGLTSQVAYELRFGLDPALDNQLLLSPGLGYEHLVFSPVDAQGAPVSKGAFVARVRFGWRHMLAASAALDLGVDAGVGNFFEYGKFPYDSGAGVAVLAGVSAAVVWGM